MTTKLTQLNRHKPQDGLVGDCFRTCIAMLLDYDCPSKVPHFAEIVGGVDETGTWKPGGSDAFDAELASFLSPLNLIYVDIPFKFDGLTEALDYQRQMNPNLYYMLSGTSLSDCNHVIVCKGGEVFHDPSQNQSGIIGPATDGHFWIGILAHNNSGVSNGHM